MTETPGTELHDAWHSTPAPPAAVTYWKLPPDAKWVDCLKRMLADESHHRDVNHALASMSHEKLYGSDNPFVHEHMADYEAGVRRKVEHMLKLSLEKEHGCWRKGSGVHSASDSDEHQ